MTRLFIFTWLLVFLVSCGGITAREHALPRASTPLITFVFDDGNDTDYLVARGIFAEQGVVACSAITTDFINTKGHMTADQIIALRDAGWEIMSHTVSHPHLPRLGPAEIEYELSRSKASLETLGITVRNLVYPYNQTNELVRSIARKFYRSGRGGAYAANAADLDPYYLKSYPIKHDLDGLERSIDRAHSDGAWIILYQHEVDIKLDVDEIHGSFIPGETLFFVPSGAVGRYEAPSWFLFFGSVYFVPLADAPKPGDTITGKTSGAVARVNRILYDDRAQLSDLIKYVRTRYPDMRIVTIDQGLDLLGVPKWQQGAGEPITH
jgi:peptidoglycan/xylan/chitin deacetylase (PgdA/CDA1 family)